MHLRKRLLAILAIVLMVTLIFVDSSLSSSSDSENGLFSVFEKKKETLYFWYNDESMADYINSAAVVFGEKNNVRVLPQLVSESEYLEAINQATLHEEQVPDAYLISNDSLEKAYLAGLAAEVKDNSRIMNVGCFPQTALDAVTYKDKKVAYPLYYETSVLLYNETYLQEWALQQAKREAEEAQTEPDETTLQNRCDEIMETAVPSTIDDILRIADSFDPPETVEGIFKWDVSDIFYNYYFIGNYMVVGGNPGDDESNVNINNPEAIACLEVYKNLNQFFYIESDQVSYESVLQDFMDGKIVFTIATTDAVAAIEQAGQEGGFAYEYGFAPIPNPGEELLGRSLSVTATVAINGYSEKQELANQFATFLVNDYAGELYERTGRVAANKKINTDNEYLQVFMDEYQHSISLPKMMATGDFWLQLEVLFSEVWNGGNVSALVEKLADRIESQIAALE